MRSAAITEELLEVGVLALQQHIFTNGGDFPRQGPKKRQIIVRPARIEDLKNLLLGRCLVDVAVLAKTRPPPIDELARKNIG